MFESYVADWFPHGYCLAWDWRLIALDVAGDVMVALSYALIPLGIVWAHLKGCLYLSINDDNYWMWITFIGACGITHALGPIQIWHPIYVAAAFAKVCTGLISFLTFLSILKAVKDFRKPAS